MTASASGHRNRLLATLTRQEMELLRPALEEVPLNLRQVLEAPGKPIPYAYFILNGLASVIAHTRHDRQIEVGMVGFEGMTGLAIVLGGDRSSNETLVQAPGSGLRIPSDRLRQAMDTSPALRGKMLRYVDAFMTQVSQTALANGRAKLEERLARWILMSHDRFASRFASGELKITHEFLAVMLGVRRPGVTIGLHYLEGKGLIRSTRGLIMVLDREGLIEQANGTYGVPEAEYERLFGRPTCAA
jgi:CRP-like cAMP-binding protein